MEWYYILLILLCALAGLIALVVLSLHIFECAHVYRRELHPELGMNDFSFDLSSGSGSGSGRTVDEVSLPTPPGIDLAAPGAAVVRRGRYRARTASITSTSTDDPFSSLPSSPEFYLASPASDLTFRSDASTASNTGALPSPSMPVTPVLAQYHYGARSPRAHLVSLDGLRGSSAPGRGREERRTRDIETQDGALEKELGRVGW